MKRLGFFLLGSALCVALPAGAWSQSKVYKTVANETVEKILQGLELKYQTGKHKKPNGIIVSFEFKRADQTYLLFNYGSDLWIESTFEKKLKLDDVNRWNAEAKFSRAVKIDEKDKTIISLESQLDCLGGVTDAMIKQFVNRFDEETKKFVKSLPK